MDLRSIRALVAGAALLLVAGAREPAPGAQDKDEVRFEAVEIYIDAGERPLAAYQFELSDPQRRIAIVGIEGGEHPAFKEPGYYDPRAMQNDRVIIAAFNTGADLPRGRTRVATVHVLVRGAADADYTVRLEATATSDGSEIPATISFEKGA